MQSKGVSKNPNYLLLFIRIKPYDFDYLKIIGKGSFGKVSVWNSLHCESRVLTFLVTLTQIFAVLQVLLARHKESTKYYAVKVLQKKIIMKKKEVSPPDMIWNCMNIKEHQ